MLREDIQKIIITLHPDQLRTGRISSADMNQFQNKPR